MLTPTATDSFLDEGEILVGDMTPGPVDPFQEPTFVVDVTSVPLAPPTVTDIVRSGLIAGVFAGFICEVMYGIGRLFGTNFEVKMGGDQIQPLPPFSPFLLPVLVAVIAALVVAWLFRRPGGAFWVFTLGFMLTILSLGLPLFQPADVTWPTRIWLVCMHLVTGAILVPALAFSLRPRRVRNY